jgi:hypothetical protein
VRKQAASTLEVRCEGKEHKRGKEDLLLGVLAFLFRFKKTFTMFIKKKERRK